MKSLPKKKQFPKKVFQVFLASVEERGKLIREEIACTALHDAIQMTVWQCENTTPISRGGKHEYFVFIPFAIVILCPVLFTNHTMEI